MKRPTLILEPVPYAQTVAEIRDLRATWRRSDDEYRAHPLVICLGFLEQDGEQVPCFNVAAGNDTLCNGCRKAAAERKRGAR